MIKRGIFLLVLREKGPSTPILDPFAGSGGIS